MRTDFSNEGMELSPKVQLLYKAVMDYLHEGVDMNNLKISDITQKAGIGKGTAYEYFTSKEEVICGGILYYVALFLDSVQEGLEKKNTFEECLNYLMDILEQNLNESGCLIRVVHLLMGNSQISVDLQDAILKGEGKLPLVIIDKMVQWGIERGEVKNDYPVSYIAYTICAKILLYATLLDMKEQERPLYNAKVNMKQMRELTVKCIVNEFGTK